MRSFSREEGTGEWKASSIARTDLENVSGFILMYALRGRTLRAMDRVLEDKVWLFGLRLRFGRTGALAWPRKKIKIKRTNERTDEKHAKKKIASGTYVVEELSPPVPVPSGALSPQTTNRVHLFVFEWGGGLYEKNDALILDRWRDHPATQRATYWHCPYRMLLRSHKYNRLPCHSGRRSTKLTDWRACVDSLTP